MPEYWPFYIQARHFCVETHDLRGFRFQKRSFDVEGLDILNRTDK